MPIYNYKCSECGHEIETILKVSELDTVKFECPMCLDEDVHINMERTFSSSNGSFQLKGDGWFKTSGKY